MKSGIVVTGLPASGKTTVAREMAKRLGFVFLDKDDFLEDLYERYGVPSWEHRKKLSRRSDGVFRDAAAQSNSAVLVSHWRPLGENGKSGTPTDWLGEEFNPIVEVCCLCSPEDALARFIERTRHPGHLDQQRDAKELAEQLASWANSYPLGLGALVEVRTDGAVDFDSVIKKVRQALSGE